MEPNRYHPTVYKQTLESDYTMKEIENVIVETLERSYPQSVHPDVICNKIIEISLEEERIINQRKNVAYFESLVGHVTQENVYKAFYNLMQEKKILYCYNDKFTIWK